jgi:hypothetical protein
MTYNIPASDPRATEPTYLSALLRRTSWGAVVAGAVVAISLQMIFTVVGVAIGATTTDFAAAPADRVRDGLGLGAALWWLVTGTLALFAGGCVVGRFTGMTRSPDVLLHALVMWGVTALFGFFVVTSGAGMLYGTSMDATYTGARASAAPIDGSSLIVTEDSAANPAGSAAQGVSSEEARRYVRTASWWTLFGLLLGIAASLAGSWMTAPNRIIVRAPGERSVT